MGHFAYLAPVGPFAGLSNHAKQQICERFPGLSIKEVESAAAFFVMELQAPTIDPRLAEVREEMNIFAKELARFQAALRRVQKHRLDKALGEASRIISGENELEVLDRRLDNLTAGIRQTSRALPFGCPELASRRLVERLARHVTEAGLTLGSTVSDLLLSLVGLIFEDLMVGGDARSAVANWRKSDAADMDPKRGNLLVDLALR